MILHEIFRVVSRLAATFNVITRKVDFLWDSVQQGHDKLKDRRSRFPQLVLQPADKTYFSSLISWFSSLLPPSPSFYLSSSRELTYSIYYHSFFTQLLSEVNVISKNVKMRQRDSVNCETPSFASLNALSQKYSESPH